MERLGGKTEFDEGCCLKNDTNLGSLTEHNPWLSRTVEKCRRPQWIGMQGLGKE